MGGSQYQASLLVRALTRNPENEVFFLSRITNPDYRPNGYYVVSVASNLSISRYRRIFDIPNVTGALRQIGPDVIYQRVGCAYTGAAAHYAKNSDCRMVWHIASDNDVLPYRICRDRGSDISRLEKRILEYGISHSPRIVAQTQSQSTLLSKHYNRDATAIIPNFHPLPNENIDKSGVLKVVWIANIKRIKRPELFIRLARDLADLEGVRFVMIGAQSANNRWQKTFGDLTSGLNNLEYLGERSQQEVNSVLAESHLLINTSFYEGFSNTFVQAWMRRVPVVSLDVNPDGIFDSRKLGIFAGSYDALLEQTKLLLGHPEKLMEMGNYSQQFAIERHSEQNIERLLSTMLE